MPDIPDLPDTSSLDEMDDDERLRLIEAHGEAVFAEATAKSARKHARLLQAKARAAYEHYWNLLLEHQGQLTLFPKEEDDL